MALRTFQLSATVSSSNPDGMRGLLERDLGPRVQIDRTAEGLQVQAGAVVGVDARELNRRLLSEMRRIEKSTRLRSSWTADGVTERFLDYVRVKERHG